MKREDQQTKNSTLPKQYELDFFVEPYDYGFDFFKY